MNEFQEDAPTGDPEYLKPGCQVSDDRWRVDGHDEQFLGWFLQPFVLPYCLCVYIANRN
jgi:hypothetical protein